MKKQAILFLVATILLFLMGCSKQNLEESIEYGDYEFAQKVDTPIKPAILAFNGTFILPEVSSKIDVPECSTFTPTTLVKEMIGPNLDLVEYELPITLEGDTFTVDGTIELEPGEHTTVAEYLKDDQDNITHASPSDTDTRFPFSQFVVNPLPYKTTVKAGTSYMHNLEMLCWTSQPLAFYGEFGFDGGVSSLSTIYFYGEPGACIDYITLQFGLLSLEREEIRIFVADDEPYPMPMRTNATFSLRAYYNGEVVWEELEQTVEQAVADFSHVYAAFGTCN